MTRAFLIMTLVVSLAGCRSETPANDVTATNTRPTPAAARNVCDLMTMDELKTAAGLQSAVGESSKSGGADVCTWTDFSGKSVVVQVFPSASSYEQSRQAFESQYGGKAEEVTMVGDKAFYIHGASGPIQTSTLVAQKGSTPVSVQVVGGSGDRETRKGEATAIAHVILGKV